MTVPNEDRELLHNFAHDLKTPLAAVKSYIELIEVSGELNDKQQHFCDRAQQSVKRMQRIITELLDFSRMEHNSSVHLRSCDLYQIAETTVGILESAAEQKNVTVHVDIPSTEQYVHADSHLLEHVMSNLVTNAIKYNRRGGDVFIKARDAGAMVRIDVEDTGIGIPQEAQHRVWERFYRVEQRNHREVEGTGLGLAIVKGVIERHGGQIRLQSTEGQGSTFTFTLPRPNSSPDYDREPPDDVDDMSQEGRESLEDSDSDLRQ